MGGRARSVSCSTANTVDVCGSILWAVQLQDPVHGGEVQAPRCHISGKHDHRFRLQSDGWQSYDRLVCHTCCVQPL